MGWAANYIEKLNSGETVSFRPKGNSMTGRIESGQLCKVEPIGEKTVINIGDVVLCKVKGREFLHLVKAVRNQQYQIANNKGFINGWITRNAIFGKLIEVV